MRTGIFHLFFKMLYDFFQRFKGTINPVFIPKFDFSELSDRNQSNVDHASDNAGKFLLNKLIDSQTFISLCSTKTINEYDELCQKTGWNDTGNVILSTQPWIKIPIYNEVVTLNNVWDKEIKFLRHKHNDILYELRIHRFFFMPKLCLMALKDDSLFSKIENFVDSWMEHAKRCNGQSAYFSNLVVLQRIIALSWSLRYLTSKPINREPIIYRLLSIVVTDIDFLRSRLGDSAPNNHLLIDYFGGWYIKFIFSDLLPEGAWKDYEALWTNELFRQVYPDGSGFEHSTHYHEMACEMASAYVILKKRAGLSVSESITSKLRSMLYFQTALAGEECIPITIGNATEDPIFPLDSENGHASGALREIYRAIFDMPIPSAPQLERSTEKAYWLLDGKLCDDSTARNPEQRRLISFPYGGVHILQNNARNNRIIFRSGPNRNVETNAGHTHSDLLSIYMISKGEPIWIDSGTYTYRLHNGGDQSINWRRYFSSPAAHNCLSINGADPLGELIGDYRPSKIDTFTDENIVVDNEHLTWIESEISCDGINNNRRRGIVYIRNDYWLIYDIPPAMSSSRPMAEMRFQCAENCVVSQEHDGVLTIKTDRQNIHLCFSNNLLKPNILFGSESPVGGWISESYGSLRTAPQILFPVKNASLPTIIVGRCMDTLANAQPTIEESIRDQLLIIRVSFLNYSDTIMISLSKHPTPQDVIAQSSPCAYAMWISEHDGKTVAAANIQKGIDNYSIDNTY